jgi:hypothetical protein
MTSQAFFLQPPPIAVWLLNQFTSVEETESILGDLLEEFSHLASKSGVAVARSWYWRQTVKTIVHLAGTGFRVAPWSTTAAILGGWLLLRVVSGLPDLVLSAMTDRYLAYWSTHFKMYMFWASDGMLMGHLIGSMVVGGMVALAAKGREMVATTTLGLIQGAMIGASLLWVAGHGPMDTGWMLWSCAGPFAIVVGGAVVRRLRSAAATPHSNA